MSRNNPTPSDVFNKWFNEQFGKRPSNKPMDKLVEDFYYANKAAMVARDLIHEVTNWDAAHNAAYKTFLASGGNIVPPKRG
jgi:hypothetical protein